MYGYQSVLKCGWKTGIHDCRGLRYEHPWLAVHRPSGSVVGCYSRREAARTLKRLKAGEAVVNHPPGCSCGDTDCPEWPYR